MENKRVCFPCYGGCEFRSLQEAVDYILQMRGGLYVYIEEIVFYNARFRDCLREKGVDGVIERMREHIADYDIQCLPKDSRICIEGCWFDGLEDIEAQAEMSGNPRHTFSKWYARKEYKHNPMGLHIGNIWEGYPVFDSYDSSDDRSYNNYMIFHQPFTEDLMEQYCKQIKVHSNACMVHEDIPPLLLPIIYYNGDSDWVLLASKNN